MSLNVNIHVSIQVSKRLSFNNEVLNLNTQLSEFDSEQNNCISESLWYF